MAKESGSVMSRELHIVGGGPAGLAAALTAAKSGTHAIVHERKADVGTRFHGDFQGLENWTTDGNVLDDLADRGIQRNFEAVPIHKQVIFDPGGREYTVHSDEPFYYLVRRGRQPGTLDYGLKEQAIASGVELWFNDRVDLDSGNKVQATGPRRVFAIVVGYLFETDAEDGTYVALAQRLAPNGYSSLLINGGRGTLASCMFSDFQNHQVHLERTLEFFRSKVSFDMKEPRRYGGYGDITQPLSLNGDRVVVGEAAGYQDALWGFGIHIALMSGCLAASSLVSKANHRDYQIWTKRLDGAFKTSVVNRFGYEKLADLGYRILSHRLGNTESPRAWLRRYYAPSLWKSVLFPVASRSVLRDGRLFESEEAAIDGRPVQRETSSTR